MRSPNPNLRLALVVTVWFLAFCFVVYDRNHPAPTTAAGPQVTVAAQPSPCHAH